MFSPKEIEAYQKIKAPNHLKQDILASEAQSEPARLTFKLRWVMMILLVSFGIFQIMASQQKTPTIFINGQSLTTTPTVVNAASTAARQSQSDMTLSIELPMVENIAVSVNHGNISFYDQLTLIDNPNECQSDNLLILWKMDPQETNNYVMDIQYEKTCHHVLVSYDVNRQVWTVCEKR